MHTKLGANKIRPLVTLEGKEVSIHIVCRDYRRIQRTDAIRKEAHSLYQYLLREGVRASFISLETSKQTTDTDEDGVIYITVHAYERMLASCEPVLVHFFESSLLPYFTDLTFLHRYRSLCTVIGNQPLAGLTDAHRETLQHMTDAGMLRIVLESDMAAHECRDAYLHSVECIYPGLTLSHGTPLPRTTKSYTIGFASSPLEAGNTEPRGIPLLYELSRALPEVHFVIAWRDPAIATGYDEWPPNVDLRMGIINMEQFYADIDALILPFTTIERTHACPFSAVEAMSYGKPVIATEFVGCSDLILREQLGAVSKATSDDLVRAIQEVRTAHATYQQALAKKFTTYFDTDRHDNTYAAIYAESAQTHTAAMLDVWESDVRAQDKVPIRGRAALQQYYDSESIAHMYTTERFMQPTTALYNTLEQTAVRFLIEKYASRGRKLVLADIAAGDGRMEPSLAAYGSCIAVDASAPMLAQIRERYDSLSVRTLLADAFTLEMPEKADVILAMRIMRHFMYADRKALYASFRRNTAVNALVIVEYPNILADSRHFMGNGNYPIYDVFWTEEKIHREAADNNLRVVHTLPVGEYIINDIPLPYRSQPLAWITALTYTS